MNKCFKISICILALLILSPLNLIAEKINKDVQIQKPRVIQNSQNAAILEKLNLARKLMGMNNYDAAMAILEVLYEENPSNGSVISNLIRCYDRLTIYTKAEELARRQIKKYDKNVHYQMTLAEFLAKQDKKEESIQAYNDAIAMVKPKNVNRYLGLVRSMMKFDFPENTLSLIDKVRTDNNDSTIFAIEYGTILEQQKSYGKAALEFSKIIDDTTRTAATSENKLMSLLQFEESSPIVEKVLLTLVDKSTSARLPRILSGYYLKAYKFEQAFNFAVKQDSIENRQGASLINYVLTCRELKLYSETVRMGEYVLNNFSGSPQFTDLHYYYADALTHLGEYEKAITVYDTIVSKFPRPQDKAEAVYRIGKIYSDNTQDYSKALIMFDSVTSNYKSGMGFIRAKMATPECYLKLGELKNANKGYLSLLNSRLDENMKEEVEYNLALIKLFEKQYDSSEVAFQKLMLDYPRGFYVNDALQILLIISEADKNGELLYLYSNALLFDIRKMPDSTRNKLESLANHSHKALADIALYKLSNLNLNEADTTKALVYVKRLEDEFPQSYYLPYALKKKADVLFKDEKKQEEAKSIYRNLLENHPNYPFISQVRKFLRKIDESENI